MLTNSALLEGELEEEESRGPGVQFLTRIIHALSKRRVGSAALTRRYARGPRKHSRALC